MAGVNVASGTRGGRRALDSELNVVPMVDLMFVILAFLLLTAAWTQMSRLDAAASVPGESEQPVTPEAARKVLDVTVTDDRVVLEWKRGSERLERAEVAIDASQRADRLAALSLKVKELWTAGGEHRAVSDHTFDRAIVHVPNRMAYGDVIAVMDAIHRTRRPVTINGKTTDAAAFELTFAK